jgi:hypothetical protein
VSTSGYSGYSAYSGSSGFSGFDGGGVTWLEKSSAYTANNLEGIIANTAGGAWELELPLSPSVGDSVSIIDAMGTFEANNLTVNTQGENVQEVAGPLICNLNNLNIELIYTGATDGWKVRTFPGYTSGASGVSGYSGYSGTSGYSGGSTSGYSGYSGNSTSGYSGYSSYSGVSGFSGTSAYSGYSGAGTSLLAVSAYSAAVTLPAGVKWALCDASPAAFTVALPTASGAASREYAIKKTDATLNAVMVSGASGAGQTIDGQVIQSLIYQNQAITIVSDGSNWRIE